MYREPHIQKKSDECALIWREWFDVNYNQENKEKGKKLRQQWCNCCDELGKMVTDEVKTNPRYKSIKL